MISKLRKFLGGKLHLARAQSALKSVILTYGTVLESRFERQHWKDSLEDPTGFYNDCVAYFFGAFQPEFRGHRKYFSSEGRGFGEDAFHVMWWMLFKEFRPTNFLEIGVYRRQTLTFAAMLQRHLAMEGQVTGISPFLPAGDTVSEYRADLDYLADTLANFRHFHLPAPELLKAFSTDVAAVDVIGSRPWDAIYIDGNHDYDVAKQDWDHCAAAIRVGGIIVLDDSGLTTGFRPPAFATGGHPGPSRLATEIDCERFHEILQVGHNRVFQRVA